MPNTSTQFKKGMTPWNKGVKMPEKSGDKHHNWTGKRICPDCKGPKSLVSKQCFECGRPAMKIRMVETRRLAAEAMQRKIKEKGFYHPLESRKKMSVFRVNNPDMQIHDTKIELTIQGLLEKYRIPFEKQIPLCGATISDFFLPKYKIAIFCDGCYWHGCKEHRSIDKAVELNKKQNAILVKNGYSVVRLWEHDINSNPEECIQRIISLINIKQ